jgi:hypothetical protein
MKTRLILVSLFAVLFFSCKNDKTETTKEDAATPAKSTAFKVTLEVIAKKKDGFSLFYTEDGTNDFSKIQPIWADAKASDAPQQIVFTLPEDVFPTQFRLDLGVTPDQEDIVIKSFTMEYMDKSFRINGDEFFIYFDPDPSKTIFDKTTGVVKAVVKDGVRQSPSFYPNTKPLGDQIALLLK